MCSCSRPMWPADHVAVAPESCTSGTSAAMLLWSYMPQHMQIGMLIDGHNMWVPYALQASQLLNLFDNDASAVRCRQTDDQSE